MFKMVMSLGLLLTVNAFAVNQNSYSQHLKVMDESSSTLSITPSFSSESSNSRGKLSGRNYSQETTEQNNIIKFEKGINSTSSFGVQTSVGRKTIKDNNGNRTAEFKFSGMSDLVLTYKALQPKELSSVIWGGDLSLSLTDHEIASVYKAGNYASGGHSIRPFIGYESKDETKVVGGLVSYQVFGDRKAVYKANNSANNYSETTTGGNMLETVGFIENQNSNYVVGVLAGIEMYGSSNTLENNGIQNDYDPATYLKAKLYSNINMNEDISLAPALQYRTLMTRNINNVDVNKNEEINLFLGLGINI